MGVTSRWGGNTVALKAARRLSVTELGDRLNVNSGTGRSPRQPNNSRVSNVQSALGKAVTLTGGAGHHDLLVSGLVGAGGNGFVITNDISTGAIIAGQATSVNTPAA